MGPEDLKKILAVLPPSDDENLLVGLDAPDDAAVYSLGDGRLLVASVDFFTPVVDDPEDFGAIAAANALSDLYAMGATPAFALSVLAVPASTLSLDVVAGILRGAAETCDEAGIVIAGGHSIDDKEPKFGLVALGFAESERVYRKSGARPGDAIVLGKALGTGIIATAVKRDGTDAPVVRAAVRSMRQLNQEAAVLLEGHEVHALTDVTGFGLLGHLREVCAASDVSARVFASAPRFLPEAIDLAEAGFVPGGTERNRAAIEPVTGWEPGIPDPVRTVLCDAQTSGGLLACVPKHEASELAAEWESAGYAASVVGAIEEPSKPMLIVEE
ncbi:MAG: selenide, water dikinase SelD [Gemmatimonadetes bacterium]|nr:selenide, water dikinase SelD [Gemmatimonadota bacterium]